MIGHVYSPEERRLSRNMVQQRESGSLKTETISNVEVIWKLKEVGPRTLPVGASRPWRVKRPTPNLFQDRRVLKRVHASEKTDGECPYI